MRSPDKIWIEPAWAETFALPDGDPAKVAYIHEAIAQAAITAALEAAAKQVGDHGEWMQSHNLIGNGYDFAGQAKAIRALITKPQHDALAAHVAAEVAKALAEDAAKIEAFMKALTEISTERFYGLPTSSATLAGAVIAHFAQNGATK